MKYNYLACIQGGLGDEVWDREVSLSAVNFHDAIKQALARAEELGGEVIAVEYGVHYDARWSGCERPEKGAK